MAFAASTDEARPVLMGVLVTVDKDIITLAAADGFRLSVRKANLSGTLQQPLTAIIPARALSELARVSSDGEESIYMVLPKGRGQVIFRVKDVEVVSQLIDGTFPDFQQIIPRSYKSRTLVSTASMLKACKQAEIFAREGSNVARLDIKSAQSDMQPSEVEISATSEETGKNETIVEATVDGGGVLIAFNVKFLREALEVIKTPNVAIEMTAAITQPALLGFLCPTPRFVPRITLLILIVAGRLVRQTCGSYVPRLHEKRRFVLFWTEAHNQKRAYKKYERHNNPKYVPRPLQRYLQC